MSPSYSELNEKVKEINEKLDTCANNLEGIESTEGGKYENPQYRMWSGDIKDLGEFTDRLQEWLSQPSVAEAKRYLLDLTKWSESIKEISLEELEGDWRFLSDNVKKIGDIHKELEGIKYEMIKKKTSGWVLERIIEKDVERAEKWANNASKFALGLKQIDDREVESKLAAEVKGDAIKELLKISSFDTDNEEAIDQYRALIENAENIVKNMPVEIEEKAMLRTYQRSKGIGESLSVIGSKVEEIKTLLIGLEWVKEFTDFKDYSKIWTDKQTAIKKSDLESVAKALESAQEKAEKWEGTHERELGTALIRTERMSKSVERDEVKTEVSSLREEVCSINWNKPDLQSLFEILNHTGKLQDQLRQELVEKLKNEDAISLIEKPEIIEDLGGKMGWDFERFIKALEVVLRNGLIEIRAAEEK